MNVLILGGSKGLGKACVDEFLKDDSYNVIVASRSISSELKKRVSFISTDFKVIKDVEALVASITKKKIDILINNSGGPASKGFSDVSATEFMSELQSHLITSHLVTQAVTKNMVEQKFGRIINIVSVTAVIPLPGMIVSNTIRGAMLNWSKTISKELGGKGITVNNILPGYTKTQRLGNVIDSVASMKGVTTKEVEAKLISEIPADRFGKPSELGALAKFLSSYSASYINGQSIAIDGGWTPCS